MSENLKPEIEQAVSAVVAAARNDPQAQLPLCLGNAIANLDAAWCAYCSNETPELSQGVIKASNGVVVAANDNPQATASIVLASTIRDLRVALRS